MTGAAGVTGRAAVSALLASGHDVVGLVRSREAAQVVEGLGAAPCPGDLFDAEALVAGMRGCDVVANLATKVPVGRAALRPGSLREIDRLRYLGSRIVAESARRADVGRVVQQSLSFVYADHGDAWIDEDGLVDVSATTEPVIVAESRMAAFTAAGGVGVSLRLGLVVGQDPNSDWMLRRARMGRTFALGDPDSWVHIVHPDDVGSAVVHALRAPAGVFNVGAEPVTRRDFADTFAAAAERLEPARFLPRWVQRLGSDKLEILTRSHRVSSARFSAATGWSPAWPALDPSWLRDHDRAG